MWLILVMLLLTLMSVFPGRDIFTCPKCGNVAEVKVYKARLDTTVGVQKTKTIQTTNRPARSFLWNG